MSFVFHPAKIRDTFPWSILVGEIMLNFGKDTLEFFEIGLRHENLEFYFRAQSIIKWIQLVYIGKTFHHSW